MGDKSKEKKKKDTKTTSALFTQPSKTSINPKQLNIQDPLPRPHEVGTFIELALAQAQNFL